MDLIEHFEKNITGDFIILSLKDSDWEDFLCKLPLEYRRCFIEDSLLDAQIKNFSGCYKTEISEILPNDGKIKSGDFGEITAYFLFKEIYKSCGLNGPKKWQWKENQNVAAPYSDVILYGIRDSKNYSNDDILISIESKMKSVRNNSYNPIGNSIKGAQKDFLTRRANSLAWLKKVYKTEANKSSNPTKYIELVKEIERFIYSEKFGEYKKISHAIAFIDKNLINDEKVKAISIPRELGIDFKVHLVGIKDIKNMYEKLYSEIKKLG